MSRRRLFIIVGLVVILGSFIPRFFATRDTEQAQQEAEESKHLAQENRRIIETRLREIPSTTVEQLLTIIRRFEELTGTRDAPPGDQPAEMSAGPTDTPFHFPPRTRRPIDPFPAPSPGPGTLKPLLCSTFDPEFLYTLGIDCERDTFVACDLTGLQCPEPIETGVPIPTGRPQPTRGRST